MSTTLEGSNKFAISSSGVQTFKPPEYLCQIHGVISSTVAFYEPGKASEQYCMKCYKDMIRKFCQPVTPV